MVLALLIAASVVQGDFDRDGRPDFAEAVRKGQGTEIVVKRGNGRRQVVFRGNFNDPYVAINRNRGSILTACGKDYDGIGCTRASPRTVALRGGELLFGNREASDYVLMSHAGHFVVVQLSD